MALQSILLCLVTMLLVSHCKSLLPERQIDLIIGLTLNSSNGGQFEFLPVEIESAGAVFSATLRVGMHAGFNMKSDESPTFFGHKIPSIGAGIEVGVFANVAEFTTNVTAQPDNQDCEVGVVQSYQFALGAAAGATANVGSDTWGPVISTSVPIWYTEMASGCAVKGYATSTIGTPSAETTTVAAKRKDMSTATITSIATYTGVNCLSIGLVNCPVSLQNTSQATVTSTIVTVVPSGTDDHDISWPVNVQNTVMTSAAFGNKAMTLAPTTGSPVSYVPPPPTSTSTSNSSAAGIIGKVGDEGHRVPKRIIIGVSVGLGVPILLAIAAGLL